MTKIKFLFLFLMIYQLGFSQVCDTIFLWSNRVIVNPKGNPSIKKDNYEGIFQVTDPLMLVYMPDKKNNKETAAIVCPGGGFTHLSIAKEGFEVAAWLNSLGITAFVLQYSVPNMRTEAFQDIQRAMRIVRSRSEEWGVNPHKVGVIGFSAGGGLSARVSCVPESMAYEPIDKADSTSCIPDFAMLIYSGGLGRINNENRLQNLSFGKGTPPMFIFGTADDMVCNVGSVFITEELIRKKVPVELHLLPEGGHGYGLRAGNSAARTWPLLAEHWLFKYILD